MIDVILLVTLFIYSLYIVYLEFFHVDEPKELSKEEIIKRMKDYGNKSA